MKEPTPEQIDQLMVDLAGLGIHIPAKDTAFFHAIVRRWLEGLQRAVPSADGRTP